MEQSDIDKLLALRSAWDKYKAITAEKSSHDINAYYEVMWTYGIERRDEIAKFNDEMCLQLLREARTMYGECDCCAGYKEIPPCALMFGAKSCFSTGKPSYIDPEQMYMFILIGARLGATAVGTTETYNSLHPKVNAKINIEGKYIRYICPPGHGYYHKHDVSEENARFDIRWVV